MRSNFRTGLFISHRIQPSLKFLDRFKSIFTSSVVWVFLITSVGGVLRRYHLGSKSLWLDEAVMYHISQGNAWQIIYRNAKMNSAPLLYPFLLRAVQVLGDTEVILRGLAMVIGILAIPLTYLTFRKFLSRGASLIITVMVAIAPPQIYYSQQVREYSLAYACSLGMLLTTWYFINNPRGRNLAALIAVWLVGIWAQYGLSVLAFSFNIVFVCLWFRNKDRRTLFRWTLAQIPILLSVVLIYLLSLRYQYVPGGFGTQYLAAGYWDAGTSSLPAFIWKQTVDLFKFAFPDMILLPAAMAVGFVSSLLVSQRRQFLIWVIAAWGMAILLGLLRLYPYLGMRQNIYLMPVLYLLAGLGIDFLLHIDKVKYLNIALIYSAVVAIQADINYYRSPGMENTRPIIAQLREQMKPGDRIYVYYAADFSVRYYLRNQDIVRYTGRSHRTAPDLYIADIDPLIHTSGRLWLFFTHCYGNECNLIRDYTSQSRSVTLTAGSSDVWLYLTQ